MIFNRITTWSALICTIIVGCDTSTAPPTVPVPLPGFYAKVIGIVDGDTIDVLTDDKTTIRIRFFGVDAPERGQPFGNNAKQFIANLVFEETLRVVELDRDRNDRVVAELYLENQRITLAIVEAGLAWHAPQYSDDPKLAAAQHNARSQPRGLWTDPRFVAPWEWRKLSKVERDKLR